MDDLASPEQLYSSPKYYAVFFGDDTKRMVPVKRCNVTDSVLADAETTEATLQNVRMLVHIARDPAVIERLRPYMRTER